ncbi:TPA: nitrate reductase subunit alpha [Vibrio parahaemolyticus]|uniref:nitrate reductase subunit alpha n=1 Tax=Vibrio parahaemolyticus TaxID=670 RepID=UPI0003C78F58|nr:nitrate reductase subunit alpha [Vibrio parahaemolyticus]MBM5118564.1 nitrate reductase subunit alpha [Vibrio parahaemolyticus]MBM5123780.1 nitrate reductase subunit alpha [Vibrio parahaemolyticus]MBM5129387.1 nitrate reductase subunit alpha [Vibrio parahaemolyticus]MBM5142370.1 nitrate reductase subunit alpha [Vibrio parahaemolyticus]MDG2651592.1 nitrate reductase subunit alpha [Vibrio parahaemolyticus]
MSKFLDRFRYFKQVGDSFSGDHGQTLNTNRDWEDGYRTRWQHDKIVRSTHGVNCTGSCSWKIYVKNGLVTWETQQTDYPRTRPDLPNHEPRGCPRGASYSWYLYSANRLKYPMVRKPLLKLWREAKRRFADPIDAWESIVTNSESTTAYKTARGRGGFVRSSWAEVNEIIAASNIYTIKEHGPDRVVGFSPIPAMSMVSYAAGARYLSLIGGSCLSFYDWYCDLPPASPMTWGEQTDVPESADWYNSSYIIAWGSNIPQTRTPDAHFFTEVRYKGTKTVAITPDYAEVAKLCDHWLNPKQGTDSAVALAMGHVILKEFHVKRQSEYFQNYLRQYSDMPMLVKLEPRADGSYSAGQFLRASELVNNLGESNNPEWKTIAINEVDGEFVAPNGSAGFRWGEKGKWNLEQLAGDGQNNVKLQLGIQDADDTVDVAFPYFGGLEHEHFTHVPLSDLINRKLPAKRITLEDGTETFVTTVYDLTLANYGVERGLSDPSCAAEYSELKAYSPAWAEKITGVSAEEIIRIATEFADNAEKTRGRSMIIVGAGLNHWYHMDMNYRGLINMLIFCGCVGQSGGGWAHYVGQEKLRPQTGWQPLAFGLDWQKPPRHMNGTSFFYNHSSQWRYEKLKVDELLSPVADKTRYSEHLIDMNVKAERMGWLPSSPQLNVNPLNIAKEAQSSGQSATDYVVNALKEGEIRFASEQPEKHYPRNMFIWRSNLLGSSGKGHEYMLKYLLGTEHGIQGKDLGEFSATKPSEVEWSDQPTQGKLDLVVTLDFRMSSTCLFSDIVLPTATWYEKDDMNTSDMHPFIHPLSAAVDPAWEAKSDWEIYKGITKAFSSLCEGHLGKETDIVTLPIQHDSPAEIAQAFDVKDWKRGECELIPGKTAPHIMAVERDYPNTYARFTSLGPLLNSQGNGGKGINWNTDSEVELLKKLNYVHHEGAAKGLAKIETAIDAAEVILTLAPETNGQVAVKAWDALSEFTGREHRHLAINKEEEKIRFRDIQAQPRKIISSPTWSGLEDEHVSYNAGYTNVHELIPWRTVTGRQQLYQDHQWMRDFGESLIAYRPPINTRTVHDIMGKKGNGNKEKALNWITPHQKWGIHSTYSENLLMLTLSRGGPIVWMSEIDAKDLGIEDNDWIEAFNSNGSLTARAVVSQRVPEGMVMMYHAQERLVNLPGGEITGQRGGIHNSVTRVCPKPTHMIGGYVHQAYGFNYYGTVGSNRDEFVVVRRMKEVKWLDDENNDYTQAPNMYSGLVGDK